MMVSYFSFVDLFHAHGSCGFMVKPQFLNAFASFLHANNAAFKVPCITLSQVACITYFPLSSNKCFLHLFGFDYTVIKATALVIFKSKTSSFFLDVYKKKSGRSIVATSRFSKAIAAQMHLNSKKSGVGEEHSALCAHRR